MLSLGRSNDQNNQNNIDLEKRLDRALKGLKLQKYISVVDIKNFIDGAELSREDMEKNDMLTEEEKTSGTGPNEARLQAQTVFAAIHELTNLFASFRRPGIINVSPEEFQRRYDKAMGEFGRGFVKTGFEKAYNPLEVPRNIKLIKYLEEIFKDSTWNSYPNPITEAFEGVNKLIYSSYARHLQQDRSYGFDEYTLK